MGLLKTLLIGATAATVGAAAVSAQTYGKYELPPYEVTAQLGDVELRAYAPYIVAEVAVEGDRRAALNQGFRILAGYIFGGNAARQSVDMTTPVAQSQSIDMTTPVAQSQSDGIWTVSFMMPSIWTLDTLPEPNNAAVRFREMPPRTEAVIVFSGRATQNALETQEAALRSILAAEGLSPVGDVQHYFYDDPMTLPWNRRNEVALVLDQ